MDYNHFFNFYGYETQNGWTGIETQLKAAGYNESEVENTFGKGWSDKNRFPSAASLNKEGTFMSRKEQLSAVNPNLNIDNYNLEYGKGYVKKNERTTTNVHIRPKEDEEGKSDAVIPGEDIPIGTPDPREIIGKIKTRSGEEQEEIIVAGFMLDNGNYVGEMSYEPDSTRQYTLICGEGGNEQESNVVWIYDTETPRTKPIKKP